jgi:hypothetical protein
MCPERIQRRPPDPRDPEYIQAPTDHLPRIAWGTGRKTQERWADQRIPRGQTPTTTDPK